MLNFIKIILCGTMSCTLIGGLSPQCIGISCMTCVRNVMVWFPMAREFGALHLMVSEANVHRTIKDLETIVGTSEQGNIGGLDRNQLCD